jgi:quercetin dioxygenase-like cupin family protein
MMDDVEPEGGDPPCWAHLFECEGRDGEEPALTASGPDDDDAGLVDLVAVAQMATAQGAVWTRQSEDLDVNLLLFAAGEGVVEHVNTEVDLLLVGITGSGEATVDGACHVLSAGQLLVIPKGTRRSTRGLSDPFAYLSCHRRRGGLRPGG